MESQDAEIHGYANSPPTASSPYVSRGPPPELTLRTDIGGNSRLLPPLQTGNPGDYSPQLVNSPQTTDSNGSDSPVEVTPAESPPDAESPIVPSNQFARLSVDNGTRVPVSVPSPQAQTRPGTLKRSPSSELLREPPTGSSGKSAGRSTPRQANQSGRGYMNFHGSRTLINQDLRSVNAAERQTHMHRKFPGPLARDSGYESNNTTRNNSLQQPRLPLTTSQSASISIPDSNQGQTVQRHNGLIQLSANSPYPGLILQPDSCPISQEQLAAEVKGIYAGLVMVEAKCINMDATQAANPKSPLASSQWQALIALHRTLLYEHHDFLMATQHPSANDALRGLAAKYSMPARMWKHGIHAFLEVLRHRRPESQDFMLNFIYLAYQMMALLFETVPSFTDTWIECLGDLARYRMAIEEEKEPHGIWGSVAARWYTMASDRNSAIGRLYHHLGILERPSLRKLCLYAKSLTCVIPFSNARDSLATLCAPIVQDEDSIQSSSQNVEPRIVTFYALVYSGHHTSAVERVYADALALVLTQYAKLKDNAAYLAYTNIAALFDLGSATNQLWQLYSYAMNQTVQSTRPAGAPNYAAPWHLNFASTQMTNSLSYGIKFCASCFNIIIRREDDKLINCGVSLDTFGHIVEPSGFSWLGLADFLNSVVLHYPTIPPHIPELARQGRFPGTPNRHQPLVEDDLIRGSMWSQFYFVPGWFDCQTEDDGRAIETPGMKIARVERVLWLGFFLAFHAQNISYDPHTKRFFAVAHESPSSHETETPSSEALMSDNTGVQRDMETTSPTGSQKAFSSSSASEDGFTVVKPTSSKPTSKPIKKRRPDYDSVKILSDEGSSVIDAHEGPYGYP